MRSTLLIATLPLLLSTCGDEQDLIIGEIRGAAEPGAGSSAGSAGSTSMSGSGSGVSGEGGTTDGGQGGDAPGGSAGASTVACIAGQEPPAGSLIHRYTFDGTGAFADDSIGAADGAVIGGPMLNGSGTVALEGFPTRQHIDLPNGLVSSLEELTIVAWVTWTGGAGYQRIFDFGISDMGEVQGGSGTRYIAMMPTTGFEDGQAQGLGAQIKAPGFPTISLASTEDIDDRAAQVGFVFRSAVNAELYLDAALLDSEATEIALSDIDDRNNWLGQSQWSKDHNLQGSFHEFRIYDTALNACQLHTLLVRGPESP
jgi:hypothetical protein